MSQSHGMTSQGLAASGWIPDPKGGFMRPKRGQVIKTAPEAIQSAGKGGAMRESDLHNAIFDYCRARGWIVLHGSMAERTHRTCGEFDFSILADRGRVFWIECKSAVGKLTPAQFAMRHQATKLGHITHVVRSFQEFIEIVNH